MKNILFVNHRRRECGVNQIGKRYYDAFRCSQKYNVHYIDVDEHAEFEYWYRELQPAAIVWNHYSGATMPWLSREVVDLHRQETKQLCIYHELDLSEKEFDLILHQDPDSTDDFPHWNLPRPLPQYQAIKWEQHEIPVFSSFGFGLGGKGFGRMVETINQQYDRAVIRLNIPFAAFGDPEGTGAQFWVEEARSKITKPGIEFAYSHDFLEEEQLLDFLAYSDCNVFLYDENYGRGIGSVLDYALAAGRPIAITHSWQFKHIWSRDDSFLVEHHTLPEIIAMGTGHLDKFRRLWSRENLVVSFENAIASIGV